MAARGRRYQAAKPPIGAAVEFTKALWAWLDQVNTWILAEILKDWADNPVHGIPGVRRTDALRSTWVTEKIGDLKLLLAERFPPPAATIRTLAARVSKKGDLEFQRVVGVGTRGLGIPNATLDRFRDENVDRIKSLAEKQLDEIQGLLQNAEANAERVEDLQAKIRERFDVTKSKAQLLARDQVLKFNGQLTQERHARAGITHYIWTASGDERVREVHRELDGTRQAWASAPVCSEDGRTGHPGDDYQCRCTAFPVLDEVDGEDLAPGEKEAPDVPADIQASGYADTFRKVSKGLKDSDLEYLRDPLTYKPQSHQEVSQGYAEGYAAGKSPTEIATTVFPPVRIEHDPTTGKMTLADGRHRMAAARQQGAERILAHVVQRGPRGGVKWKRTLEIPLTDKGPGR